MLGLVCPHAGYVYSGAAAAWAYGAIADAIPDTAVILGPNHHSLGPPAALSPDDEWATPLGTLKAAAEVAEAILRLSKYCQPDELAHAREHSIEVQLPFIQYLAGDAVRIVPISLAHLGRDDALALVDDLGNAIAEALRGRFGISVPPPEHAEHAEPVEAAGGSAQVPKHKAVIIASSDFTHYESKSSATAKDALAIEHILALDARGLIETVYSRGITMCGVIGTAVMIDACVRLGATSARKLTYFTSGDVTGDTDQVVGYAAIALGAESSSA